MFTEGVGEVLGLAAVLKDEKRKPSEIDNYKDFLKKTTYSETTLLGILQSLICEEYNGDLKITFQNGRAYDVVKTVKINNAGINNE
jgi:hypothetical protein